MESINEIFGMTLILLVGVRMVNDHTLFSKSWESSYLSILALLAAIVVILSFVITRAIIIFKRLFLK